MKELFSGKVLKYGAVFHHYNKWSKNGEWKSLWLQLLDKHRSALDMSSVDLDGSHTPAIRGGEEVGYQGRKRRKTTLSGTAWSLWGWTGVVVVGLSLALGSGLITVCTRR